LKFQREQNQEAIENLENYIQEGALRIDENHNIIHKLIFPLVKDGEDGNVHTEELKYKARLQAYEQDQKLKNVKPMDINGRFAAIASALTGKATGTIKQLDSSDYAIMRDVVTFFL
jgi:hypothetical protein